MAEVEIQMPLHYAEKDVFGVGQGDAAVSGLLERTNDPSCIIHCKDRKQHHHMPLHLFRAFQSLHFCILGYM